MDRILRGTAATLHEALYADSVPVAPDEGISVTITGPTGVVVVSGEPADLEGVGGYSFVFPPQAQLGIYTIDWAGTFRGMPHTVRSKLEVVGARIFTMNDARNTEPFTDVVAFTADEIEQARIEIETEFQQITGMSFIPRHRRVVGDTPDPLDDPVNAVAVTADGFCDYEYGLTDVPADIRRAALRRLKSILLADKSGIPDRATSFVAAEGGTYTIAQPGRSGYETGIPNIDATLKRYKISPPGVW